MGSLNHQRLSSILISQHSSDWLPLAKRACEKQMGGASIWQINLKKIKLSAHMNFLNAWWPHYFNCWSCLISTIIQFSKSTVLILTLWRRDTWVHFPGLQKHVIWKRSGTTVLITRFTGFINIHQFISDRHAIADFSSMCSVCIILQMLSYFCIILLEIVKLEYCILRLMRLGQ